MKKTIERYEKQYLDIENFKDFELSNNIAFEMMIRNDDARNLIETIQITSLNLENLNDYSFLNIIQEKIINNYYYYSLGIDNWLKYYNFSEFYEPNSEFIYASKSKGNPYYSNNTLYINEEYKDFIYISSKTDDISKKNYNDLENDNIKEGHSIKNISEYIENIANIEHNIFPSFSRPRMIPPARISKLVNLYSINLSLHEEELIKYIKHVRNEFLKDHKIIKTPSEILGENINISVDLITRDKNKTMQEKFADMMFIYDALKIKMKKNIIQRSILNYYNDKYKDKFIPNMDYSTITNYSKIAINYIDNLKYKELINPI